MNSHCIIETALAFFLVGQSLAGAGGAGDLSAPGVVDKVWNVEVIQNSPIVVELALAQDEVISWENFVMTVRLRNRTTKPIVLRGFSPDTSLAYIWVSINGEQFSQIARIHPGDVYVPARGAWTTVLGDGEVMQWDVFLARDERLVPLKREWLTRDSIKAEHIRLSVLVCPVLSIVDGDDENAIAVESNVVDIDVRAPTHRQREALRYLIDLDSGRGEDHIPFYEQYRRFLARYPDVPYAERVRYNVVRDSAIHNLKTPSDEAPSTLLESIDFCLERGTPFSDALMTVHYFRFLSRTERWEQFERAAKVLVEAPSYDHRFHELQARVGGLGVHLVAHESQCKDATWRAKLRPLMLKCLERTLERADADARVVAPNVLENLERMKEWSLLERAAELALEVEDNPQSDKAARALEVAQAHLAND